MANNEHNGSEVTIESGRTTYKIQWSEYKGRLGLDIRKHFISKQTGELVPSRKGIWIPEADSDDVIAGAVQVLERKPQ